MWKLSIADDQGQRTTVNLARDEYTIGRADGNAIRLTERNVSRLHAVIRRAKDGFLIEDLGSQNGTLANGVRVAKAQELAHGDLLQIGDYRLDVIDEELSTQEQAHRPLFAATGAPNGALPGRLVVLIGPNQGYEFPLLGERHLIGRGEECEFSMDHASVSRVHAEVRRIDPDHFEILDKGSSNGLRVNSRDMPRAMLDNGDVIEIGDVILKFVAEGQMFRASPEEGARLAAFGTARPTAVPSETPQAGLGRRVVAALLGAAVAVAVTWYFIAARASDSQVLGKPTGFSAAKASSLPDALEASLRRAEALQKKGALTEAHELARSIVSPPVLPPGHPRIVAVEQAWADAALERAAKAADPGEKKLIWDEVARTETVPPRLRQEASRLLERNRTSSISLDEIAPTANVPESTGPKEPHQ